MIELDDPWPPPHAVKAAEPYLEKTREAIAGSVAKARDLRRHANFQKFINEGHQALAAEVQAGLYAANFVALPSGASRRRKTIQEDLRSLLRTFEKMRSDEEGTYRFWVLRGDRGLLELPLSEDEREGVRVAVRVWPELIGFVHRALEAQDEQARQSGSRSKSRREQPIIDALVRCWSNYFGDAGLSVHKASPFYALLTQLYLIFSDSKAPSAETVQRYLKNRDLTV